MMENRNIIIDIESLKLVVFMMDITILILKIYRWLRMESMSGERLPFRLERAAKVAAESCGR